MKRQAKSVCFLQHKSLVFSIGTADRPAENSVISPAWSSVLYLKQVTYTVALGLICSGSLAAMKTTQDKDWVVHTYDTKESNIRPQAVPYEETQDGMFTIGQMPRPARENSKAIEYDATPRPLHGRGPIRESIVNKKDGRKRITPTTTWPNSIHGQIGIGVDGDPHAVGGSGTFVGPYHFLTAAHFMGFNPLLKKISPVAWRHIHFQGHFVFSNINVIDLDEIIQKLILDSRPGNAEK